MLGVSISPSVCHCCMLQFQQPFLLHFEGMWYRRSLMHKTCLKYIRMHIRCRSKWTLAFISSNCYWIEKYYRNLVNFYWHVKSVCHFLPFIVYLWIKYNGDCVPWTSSCKLQNFLLACYLYWNIRDLRVIWELLDSVTEIFCGLLKTLLLREGLLYGE